MSDDLFDLPTDLAASDYVVKHPVSGALTSARISLAGPSHPLRRTAVFSRMRALLAAGEAEKVDLESADDDETAFIATCTLGWSGLSAGGVPLPFAVGAAQTLYADVKYRWLRDQVRDALRVKELFIGAPATA